MSDRNDRNEQNGWHVRAMAAATALAAALAAAPARGAETPPAVRVEVEALIERLATSGCEFERSGKWHDAVDAATHLRRKRDAGESMGMGVATTEEFIDRAAARTSLGGRAYRVRCAGQAPVESMVWLGEQLKTIRAAKRGGAG